MKSDLSLRDLKKQKIRKVFFKKELSDRFRFFFDIEAPYETRTIFSSHLVY